jgi:hypothetical protein
MSAKKLVASVILGSEHTPTGRTRHLLGATELPLPHELRIVTCEGEAGYYLLHYAEDGEEFADTWHHSVDEALQQADWEFQLKKSDWTFVS